MRTIISLASFPLLLAFCLKLLSSFLRQQAGQSKNQIELQGRLFSNLKMSLKESPEGDNIDTDRSINFGRVIRERFLGNEILPKDER